MAEREASSFIPKQILTRADRPPTEPVNILFTIGFTVLVISGLFLGVVYIYRQQLDRQINSPCTDVGNNTKRCGLVATLELEKKNLDEATILLLQRTDRKLKVAKEIIGNHIDLLPIFRLLEDSTIPTIRYTQFTYDAPSGKSLSLRGEASSYEDIAVQGRIFGRDRIRIKDFIFSDLDLDQTGKVIFKLDLTVDPKIILFGSNPVATAYRPPPLTGSSTATTTLP